MRLLFILFLTQYFIIFIFTLINCTNPIVFVVSHLIIYFVIYIGEGILVSLWNFFFRGATIKMGNVPIPPSDDSFQRARDSSLIIKFINKKKVIANGSGVGISRQRAGTWIDVEV